MNPTDDNTTVPSAVNASNTKDLLRNAYDIYTDELPLQACKSQWKKENVFGFLMGVAEYGVETHVNELNGMLQSIPDAESAKEAYLKDMQGKCIDRYYDYYIRPFKKHNGSNSSSENTGSEKGSSRSGKSSPKSRASSQPENTPIEMSRAYNSLEKFAQTNRNNETAAQSRQMFKDALLERDVVCLFCWDKKYPQAAHIIALRPNIMIPVDVEMMMKDAGFKSKNQVQNGLLLCIKCHNKFDRLKWYVDYVDMKFVVKVVNFSNDTSDKKQTIEEKQTSDKEQTSDKKLTEWKYEVEDLKVLRDRRKIRHKDDRKTVESNGEMALYFNQNDHELQPSRIALERHKTACLIWRMAGGAESEDEDYDDDGEDFVPVFSKPASIREWMESSDTLFNEKM